MPAYDDFSGPLLYKYCTPERVDILVNGFVRITQPICFNDIFETQPVPEINIADLDISSEEKVKIWDEFQRSPNLLLDSKGDVEKSLMLESLLNRQKKRFSTITGVTCFSEVCNSILMWAHYTRDFQGFVFGVNSHDLPFVVPKGEHFAMRKVIYSSVRPKLSLKEINVKSPENELLKKWFATKSEDWKYEQEWRLIKYLSSSDNIIDQQPYPIHLIKLDIAKISCVIIGCRASEELKASLISICENYRIPLFFQIKSSNNFKLLFWDYETYKYKTQQWTLGGKEDIGFRNE